MPRRFPPVRLAWTLAALLLAGGLGGCGGESGSEGGAPRLELLVCELDGEPPTQGLTVERREGRQMSNKPLAARPVAGLPRVFEVPGAADGQYYLRLPDGWGQLVLNSLPHLEAGGRPALFRVGRPHTLYLDSHLRGRLLGDVWGARYPDARYWLCATTGGRVRFRRAIHPYACRQGHQIHAQLSA